MKADIRNRLLAWVDEAWKEAEEANKRMDRVQKTDRRALSRSIRILTGWISVAMGLILFFIYAGNGGIFASGIDYSGHGVWGMLALLLTCISLAGIVIMIFFWIIGYAPRKKLRRVCLPVAFTLLALFILGVARHSPAPILTELGSATASGLAFFIGLYAPVKE